MITVAGSLVMDLTIHVPSLVQPGGLVHGHHLQVRTLLNAAPALQLRSSLLALCDIVIVNEHEAATLSGRKVGNVRSAANAGSEIKRQGARGVVVTMGAAGVWADFAAWQGHVPSYAVQTVDTLGAGDTFTGALSVRLCEGVDVRSAVAFATAAAALSVTRPGAQPSIPYREEVEAFIAAGKTYGD